MASLREYFDKDGSNLVSVHHPLVIMSEKMEPLLNIIGRLHLDFESNSKYVSYYIPSTNKVGCPARMVLNSLDQVLSWTQEYQVEGNYTGEEVMTSSEMNFTGRVFIYSEDYISDEDLSYIKARAKDLGHSVQFRFHEYAEGRDKAEKPLAFISHDSRDKDEIARPLALGLQKELCPVWYDEFSLKVGDSLRDSIEHGLKECPKCIFVLTPNFLVNGGWAKAEYDSIFTRELVEGQRVILPIWHNVTKKDIYEYSPLLAGRVAVRWDDGEAAVVQKIMSVIRT